MAELSEGTSEQRRESSLLPSGLTGLELAALAVVALHLIIPSWPFGFPTVGKTATLLLLAPIGLTLLAMAARRREVASMLLAAFLAVALVSGLAAESPLFAIRGDVTSWMTVVVYAAAAAWWSVGRHLGPEARRLLPWVFVSMMAFNALVGLLQVVLEIRSGPLAIAGGRAHGLLDNPVFFGTLGAGVCGWWVMSAGARSIGVWTAGAAIAGFATGLSASRAATGAVVLACLFAIVVKRSVATWAAAVATTGGLIAASWFSGQFSSTGTLVRLAENPGSSYRWDLWKAGLAALPERPILGHGFNHFATAVDGELALSFLRDNQVDDLTNPTRVPHNFVILLLVSVGIVGTLVFAAWLVAALRGTLDIALLAAAAAIAANWMLQPASQHSLPVALLFLGAAVRAPSGVVAHSDVSDALDEPRPSMDRRVSALAGVAGAVLACYVLVGMYRVDAASERGPDELASAARWFPDDADVARAVSVRYEAAAARGETDLERGVEAAIRWANVDVGVAPSAQSYSRIARLQLALGRFDDARTSLDRAFDLQHWNPNARELLVSYAIETDDDALLRDAMSDACLLDLAVCDDRTTTD